MKNTKEATNLLNNPEQINLADAMEELEEMQNHAIEELENAQTQNLESDTTRKPCESEKEQEHGTHTHVLEDGTVVTHSHEDHGCHGEHGHHHSSESTKAIINRMNRAIGHMESIKRMIEDDRDCSEVLIQIAAVRSAINNIGKVVLEEHINTCIADAIEHGDKQVIDDLNDAIKKFVK